MINRALRGTSVTVVLIGAETAHRPWVKYEIQKSLERGNGMLGIYIHRIRDTRTSMFDRKGRNPFDNFRVPRTSAMPLQVRLSSIYRTYDWVLDNGYNNFSTWVERAARQAGKS
jgi:hypothetical protein